MSKVKAYGYHISALIVGNLYVVCPDIIERGIVHIVTPPLYGIDVIKGGKDSKRVYLPDEAAVIRWMSSIYTEALKIGVRSSGVFDNTRYLNEHESIDFIRLLLQIGEQITNIANELVLEPILLEALTHATGYMHHGNVDTTAIAQITGADSAIYDENGHILILSVGRKDYIIPLQNVCERLYSTIIPLLAKIAWRKLDLFITTKHTNVFKDQQVTVMQLYMVLKSFDDMFTIKRFKGLGQMPPEDRAATCMDVNGRTLHQITTTGDVAKIFQLLGGDSVYRKRLVSR